ncbi:MAG TPA: hypothetical protein VN673_17060 [Clostridia bacterium]|nr:hypothetical protein [Clostridia bacterium]
MIEFDEEKRSEHVDPLYEYPDFDFDSVEFIEAIRSPKDEHYARMGEALRFVLTWIVDADTAGKEPGGFWTNNRKEAFRKQAGARRSVFHAGVRAVVLLWTLSPESFASTPSLREMARLCRVNRKVLTRLSLQVKRDMLKRPRR